jgi:hypothetical protein
LLLWYGALSIIKTVSSLQYLFLESKCWQSLIRNKRKVALVFLPWFTVKKNSPILETAAIILTYLSLYDTDDRAR